MLHNNREADSVREAVYVGSGKGGEDTDAIMYGNLINGEVLKMYGKESVNLDKMR